MSAPIDTKTTRATRRLCDIACDIADSWGEKINFAARPYLLAMAHLDSIDDRFGCDTARGIVAYFLSNATTWRGEEARTIKAELRAMLGGDS